MAEKTLSAEPTASSLKKQLSDSLETLKKDFENLTHFVTELASDGTSMPVPLTKNDLADLLAVTLEISDAANDIEFEASKIKEQLSRFVM